MHIATATELYESWLALQIPLIEADLAEKHIRMQESAMGFLRGTFYRWARRFPEVCPRLMDAPIVLAAGDLHVQNFGTWKNAAGKIVWGINDFDEACKAPYTVDLVRLAVSAMLSAPLEKPETICRTILDGYLAGLAGGGQAIILNARHTELTALVRKYWRKKKNFERDLELCPDADAPSAIRTMLRCGPKSRIVHRQGGLGSLGRRRFTGISNAMEAKELAPSAWSWAKGDRQPSLTGKLLKSAVRSPDPLERTPKGWIVRPYSQFRARLELETLGRGDALRALLGAMGWETANVHAGSKSHGAVLVDCGLRKPTWLAQAAEAMAADVDSDWRAFAARSAKAARGSK